MDLQIHLPAFLFRYMSAEYGPGPYDLKEHAPIKLAFLHWGVYSDAWPPLIETPEATYLVLLKVPESLRDLAKIAANHSPSLFTAEFYLAAINYTEGFMDGQYRKRKEALGHFLARYDISEDVYPLETAYRNMHRWLERKRKCRELLIPMS